MPSSVIRSFAYDPAAHRLDIRFLTGRTYSYEGVPEEIAEAMRDASSKGRFFNAFIRDRFPFVRRR